MDISFLSHANASSTMGNYVFSSAFATTDILDGLSTTHCRNLLSDLAFLQPSAPLLQSIILVGSTACGLRSAGSDIDLVLVTKEQAFEDLCESLFEKEIEEALAGRNCSGIEYTVLAPSQVEELFALSSPFSHAIRHGLILHDNGYMQRLFAESPPSVPPRRYYLKVFCENIASQYFSVLQKTENEIREMGCSVECCETCCNCSGLLSAAIMPHLITKMLYLTLPARGLMPLTKKDAVDFAETFYPEGVAAGAKQAVIFMRNKNRKISFKDFRSLRKTAAKLFREILTILGGGSDVQHIIKDAANIVRGNYRQIENNALKNCVL